MKLSSEQTIIVKYSRLWLCLSLTASVIFPILHKLMMGNGDTHQSINVNIPSCSFICPTLSNVSCVSQLK